MLASSPTAISRSDDWSTPNIHISGYLFLDEVATYQLSPDLTNFLAGGTTPVCVTFGSMIHRRTDKIYRTVLDALYKTNNRAIVLSGWSNLQNIPLSENIFVTKAVPRDWLLPRCKMIVHHGGAGTTSAGLRSGIPNIVVSFATDQPFWGARVHAIKAGPKPIPVKRLTIEKLIMALAETDGDTIRNGAQAVDGMIRSENGLESLVRLIESYIENWQKSSIL